jgi:hypothetical protein
VFLCALDAHSGGECFYACGFGICAGLVVEICSRTGGAGGLGRVHIDGGGGGIFFDCDWDGGVLFSGKEGPEGILDE